MRITMRFVAVLGALLASCGEERLSRAQVAALFGSEAMIASAAPDAELAALGKRLYHATELSRNGAIACASCHDLTRAGQDGRVRSTRFDGTVTARNTPSTMDAFRQVALGWDGAQRSLDQRTRRCLAEMHGLGDDAAITAAARTLTGAEIESVDVVAALVAFLRTLRTTGRWDRFVDGDEGALTAAEQQGLTVFVRVGCAVCHQGRLLGGATFHRLGIVEPHPTADPGRFAVTGAEVDRAVFAAPPLVDVERTAPYLHDGSAATLAEAVRLMGRHQLATPPTAAEARAIVVFLEALTAEPAAPDRDLGTNR